MSKDEPVCEKDPQGCWSVRCQLDKKCKNTTPQRTWVNLNLTEIEILFIQNTTPKSTAIDFARAIEAKLKEKNT